MSVDTFSEQAAAAAVFLSADMKDHLANWFVTFGSQIKEKENINDIFVSRVGADGVDIDVVTCDAMGCVCLKESVPWMDGAVLSDADELVPAICRLSEACGLDTSALC